MKRKGSAEWMGSLKEGKGTVTSDSGVLNKAAYSFGTRFESQQGTNPEELIAAAHAGCFSMAFSAELGRNGMTPEFVRTNATMSFEKLEAGWTGTSIHLDVAVKVAGADAAKVMELANVAKTNCPVSRLLNAKITMEAKIET
ncbi:MAG: OsmC family protein [Deltaproteobacteria bacterium]|nr:OsmC family protein [Deltaproteobacteria bacterium]